MRKSSHNQSGATLMELVVMIIIMSVVFPVILNTISYISIHSTDFAIMDQAMVLAEQRMEEIIGQKEAQWNWYQNPSQFAATENLADGYVRTTTVSTLANWGFGAIDGWEVRVSVVQPQRLPNGYSLVVRLSKYVEQ
jgi:type II secretory pathway pseudopilin PulG